ncbi:MAG TPA: c-type cytochrome, partial [Verrucomicrobiae bacterium]|nr:c-type cytochrome [Verrucomicrobiae bacterium]
EWIRETLRTGPAPLPRQALLRSLVKQPVDPGNVPFLLEGLRDPEDATARAMAAALVEHRPALTRELAAICLERASSSLSLMYSAERLLTTLAGKHRPGYRADADPNGRAGEADRDAFSSFWGKWYRQKFGEAFVPGASPATRERSDEEVSRFIQSEASHGGTAQRGATIFQRLQCPTCHGGGASGGEKRLFGPDLSGITRRLSRAELAEALAFPSRRVEDRFKAFQLEKKDGTILTGFITEQADESVTIASLQSVERVPRGEIARLAAQTSSLMPSGLLSKLSDDEFRDLLAFIEKN